MRIRECPELQRYARQLGLAGHVGLDEGRYFYVQGWDVRDLGPGVVGAQLELVRILEER